MGVSGDCTLIQEEVQIRHGGWTIRQNVNYMERFGGRPTFLRSVWPTWSVEWEGVTS